MTFNVFNATTLAWSALGALWLGGFLFTKPVMRSQSVSPRLFHLALGCLGFAMLATRWFHIGWMASRFVPGSGPAYQAIQWAGLVLTIAGCLLAASARIVLGGNWSGGATVKSSHELVVKGPYALTRHPIYTGFLLAVFGTALVVGEWHSLVSIVVIFLAIALKIGQEEILMLRAFPESYPRYRQQVKALIPGVL
jgi:protein-S-isoprenylcysteine O-methyltransferase Ste14